MEIRLKDYLEKVLCIFCEVVFRQDKDLVRFFHLKTQPKNTGEEGINHQRELAN
ncbi:hypothetical protein NIES4072_51890 [Nostoc commune NIES-4072]|uniref:Uncharacterized protein n=1 Tax=Nostoc commune NIES-4072 TaxID=2005467 RepID=A0A2R5FZ32_NOSCO|nr:hypothetical protein NIES4070_39060 [Nostoc commune HK-02]GBG21503.1 hypothetical protein NIES4072_51890 [Nostoc commune NIES-4072]